MATLAHHNEDLAFEAISPLVFDREERTRSAAGRALVKLGDERGIEVLDQMASTSRTPEWRERADGWRDRLSSVIAGDSSEESTRQEIERLKRDLEELRSKVDGFEAK